MLNYQGMYINVRWNWLFSVCTDQQHFAKTKMEYISLPTKLNAIIGITSYCCVILEVEILHNAIKTIQNVVFVLFFLKNQNLFL